jgi:biotin synthase
MDWLIEKAERGDALNEREALAVLEAADDELDDVLAAATLVRQRHFGKATSLCSILNARSGACSEDCAFCAQSCHNESEVDVYPLLPSEQIAEGYRQAAGLPIKHFGIVTSGASVQGEELERICQVVRDGCDGPVAWCASLGELDVEALSKLRDAGLTRYHHNLETAESFFGNICSTHTWADRVRTVRATKQVGLAVCCGGLFGLGESPAQRVELAFALHDLEVDAIPLNFLVALEGTRLADAPPLRPECILKIIAMFRLVCPTAEIKVCAGREAHLAEMEGRIFEAGATGMMIGGYLTVRGRAVAQDLEMLREAGMDTNTGDAL